MRKQLITTAAITIIFCQLSARQLTPQEALARVIPPAESVNTPMSVNAITSAKLCRTFSEGDLKTVYLFSRDDDGGYLVVSADDSTGPALLGYSDGGVASGADIPENFNWWLGQYSREIASMLSSDGETGGEESVYPEREAVAPFVATLWNQTEPYNDLCPEINGVRCPTGCVATAMAQAMSVFKWPETGVGSHSYTPYDVGKELTVDFSATHYEWDKMLNQYTTDSPQENIDAVATLMYSCGVSISMQYHPNASGGNYTSAVSALINYFNYDKGLRNLGRDYYGIEEWCDMIYDEIAAGRPVLYSGRNDEGGHAFVCDGYEGDGYYHINWGWGGLSNGYFLLTALDPKQQGVGGSSSGYNLEQTIVIGMQKPQEDSYIIPVFRFISNFSTTASSYAQPYTQVVFSDRRGIFNESAGTVTAAMGVKLTDESGNVSYVESSSKEYLTGQGFTQYSIIAQDFPDSGTYVVTPAVKDEKGKWWDCEVGLEMERSLKLIAGTDSLRFVHTKEASAVATDVKLLSPIYPGLQCGVGATLTNRSGLEFYEEVVPVLVKDGAEVAQATPIAVELLPGESEYFEWIGEFSSSLAAGDYELYLVDAGGKDISSAINVTVKAAPTGATAYTVTTTTLSGEQSTEDMPAQIAYNDVSARVNISCTQGYFTGIMHGSIWEPNQALGVTTIEGPYVGVDEGEEKSFELHKEVDYLTPGKIYYIQAYCPGYGYVGNKLYFTSNTMGIDVIGADNGDVTVGPNPAADRIAIVAPEAISNVDIYTLSGSTAISVDGSGDKECHIDVSMLRSGLYLVVVATEAGEQHVAKLVKR